MAWQWLDDIDELSGSPGNCNLVTHDWDAVLALMNESEWLEQLPDVSGNILTIGGSGDFFLGDDPNVHSKQALTSYDLRIQLGDNFSQWAPGAIRIQKISSPQLGMTTSQNVTMCTWRLMVNTETEEVTAWYMLQYDNQYTRVANAIVASNRSFASDWYDFLIDGGHATPPVEHVWETVVSVSGEMGKFNFSGLKDELIPANLGVVTVTDVSDFQALTEQTSLETLTANAPYGYETKVMYAGKVDYLTITKVVNGSSHEYVLKFYIAGGSTPFYTESMSILSEYPTYLGFVKDDENGVAALQIITKGTSAGGFIQYRVFPWVTHIDNSQMETLYLWLHTSSSTPDITEDDEDGEVDPWHDTEITGLTVPTKSAIATGFTSMYEVTDTALKQLSSFLWSSNFLDNVTKFFSDPREIIVGLSIMPVKPDVGSDALIKAGEISTGIYGKPLTDQYKLLEDVATIKIKQAKERKCLNYEPYTKITMHLPFCGEHSLSVSDVMGKTLKLSYLFDMLTGSVIAMVKVNGKPRYFYGGSCGIQIPTSSEDFGRMYSSILSAGATLGTSLATMATGGLAAPLMMGAASNMLANGMNMSPTVAFTSGNGSINGMLSSQTAFIVVETPEEQVAEDQEAYTGRMSLKTRKLSTCSGFTKCFKVHLDSIVCLDSERTMIEQQLTEGVRIEEGSETPEYTPTSANDEGIIFLKMTSDGDVLGKTFSDALTIEGKLLHNENILKPTFVIEGNVFAYNYAYIPLFNRFYYITDMVVLGGSMTEVHFSVDFLQSHKEAILANDAIIERQEKKYNTYLNDTNIWTKQNKNIDIIPFLDSEGNEFNFARENNCYILTIAGG